jgi:membrane protein DedA with SNARE-associated domain
MADPGASARMTTVVALGFAVVTVVQVTRENPRVWLIVMWAAVTLVWVVIALRQWRAVRGKDDAPRDG